MRATPWPALSLFAALTLTSPAFAQQSDAGSVEEVSEPKDAEELPPRDEAPVREAVGEGDDDEDDEDDDEEGEDDASSLAPVEAPAADADELIEGLALMGFGQLFADYAFTSSEAQSFNEFVLRRAELGLGVVKDGRYGFIVNTEAIRSAGPRSYFGIDDNSLVMRVKQGFGFAQPELGPGRLTLRIGMIPDVWVEVVEQAYDLRGISPLTAEQSRFYDTSDLGASAAYALWDGLLELRVGLTNGEGRNQYELNTGKNTTAVLSVRPVRFELLGEDAVLGVHGSYRDGSIGTSSRQNHRVSGALTLTHPRLFVGGEYGRAMGYLGRGDLDAQLIGAWASGALYPRWLGAFARFSLVQTDLSADDADAMTIGAGLYADLIDAGDIPRSVLGFPRLRLYASWRSETFGEQAALVAGAPEATNANVFMLTLSARGNAVLQ